LNLVAAYFHVIVTDCWRYLQQPNGFCGDDIQLNKLLQGPKVVI
jgi:hypothetical protein